MKPVVQEKWEGKTPRSKLPTSAFGIPDQRKFPLDNEKHVRSAIKLFGHASTDKKKSLAHRIRSAAKKYNIDIADNTQVHKYLSESSIHDIIPNGVKNIIFDFGSVLVNHDTRSAFIQNHIPEEYVDEVLMYANQVLFYPDDFNTMLKMDKTGVDDAKRIFNEALPEYLKPYVEAVFNSFIDGLMNFDYTNRLLDAMRQKEYRLYYLSNWYRFSYDKEKEYFDNLTAKFDGGLFSWQSQYMKPQIEFYQELLHKYDLNPSECIFFDDREENLIPAQKLGMHTHQFDKKSTPIVLLEMEPLELKWQEMSNTLLLNTPFGPEVVAVTDIDEWFVRCIDDHSEVESAILCHTLYLAINRATAEASGPTYADEFFVYIPSDYFRMDKVRDVNSNVGIVKVGKIYVDANTKDWYWIIQYPIERMEDNYIVSGLSEFTALNAINPVIGRNRHFLLNYGDPSWKQHMAYVNDYESDKGLIVNSSGVLETVYIGHLDPTAIYEYTGPKGNIDKLAEAYRSESKVDSIYSLLSGREVLTEDQIEYDPYFTKVDLEQFYEHAVSTFATLNDRFIAAECGIDQSKLWFDTHTKPAFMEHYNACGDIDVYKDLDGYYFYSEMTHRRSKSVESSDQLTECMLQSIM